MIWENMNLKQLEFHLIKIIYDKGDVIGDGTHERFVINVEKFMSK